MLIMGVKMSEIILSAKYCNVSGIAVWGVGIV
jgi:hypothetical protein